MEFDMATVKPDPLSFLIVGLMAVLFIVLLKILDAKWAIPGVHDIAQMV